MTTRDTAEFYVDGERRVAETHLNFALENGGARIHDAAAATGDYVEALIASGRHATGSDINESYTQIAKGRGIPVETHSATALPMADSSVDTILLFEVLEHIAELDTRLAILREVRRVASLNVLITTPDSTHLEMLRQCGLTYEHMLDRDHKVFYSQKQLEDELAQVFEKFVIAALEPTVPRLVNMTLAGDRLGISQRFFMRRMTNAVPYRFFAIADV